MIVDRAPAPRQLAGVALVSATLLMTELCLTRIFSVVMFYHFAFLAISIALFGLSASGVFAFVARRRLESHSTELLLARQSVLYGACTIVSLFVLVRLRVELTYSPRNLALMLAIYGLAALPFFTGGLVITLAISRLRSSINSVYAADLLGAAGGCLLLIPLLDRLGAPGVILTAAAAAFTSAALFSPRAKRLQIGAAGLALMVVPIAGQWSGRATFDVTDTKGHRGDRVIFSKWNSFSRVGVYERTHGDWSLSASYQGERPDTRFMDIDSAASTPILHVRPDLSDAQYLRYELTALGYAFKSQESGPPSARLGSAPSRLPGPGFTALVIGPGGGRDLVSALVFGAAHVDGVEINPIIANEVMRGRFREFSGGIYSNPRVRIAIDDGRSFVRRSPDRYDVIQASLVDTWAATAAGAYTLTENTLYTVEAFDDYLDHLTDDGVLTITRWVMDGLRLVSLAQAACEPRGWDPASRLAILQHERVVTFMLKKSPFTREEVDRLRAIADALRFQVVYLPGADPLDAAPSNDYARLIRTADRAAFYERYPQDLRPTTDDRPFFFHTTKLKDQVTVAFGRSMLFGNGLSALLTLLGISIALVALFVLGPLIVSGGARPRGWLAWLTFFGALGAGFMLVEVAVLQRFVLLLGHPVYSLTVTLCSLLLGTGVGARWSQRFDEGRLRRTVMMALGAIAVISLAAMAMLAPFVAWAIPFSRNLRIVLAAATLIPMGVVLGMPMPAAIRVLSRRAPQMVTWAWGMNGALSVLGATFGIFIAMNWGFSSTLGSASVVYLLGFAAFALATRA